MEMPEALSLRSALPCLRGLRFLAWIHFPKQRKELAIAELALEALELK